MQVDPDSDYEYAKLLDFISLKNLCISNKYFHQLCQTQRFKKLIKERYEETFPVIKYKNRFYKYDSDRNIYLNEDKTQILVQLNEEENWKPYENAISILEKLERFLFPVSNNIITIRDDDYNFKSVKINLNLYDMGIHYVHFYNNPRDAGETSTGFNLSKYLKHYEPETAKRLKEMSSIFRKHATVTFNVEDL